MILHQGERSNDKLYVCAHGHIGVFMRKCYSYTCFVAGPHEEDDYRTRYGDQVNECGVGDGFGERALLDAHPRQAVRSATCVAITDVVALSLDRAAFMDALEQIHRATLEKLALLSATVPHFEHIGSELMAENLMYSFKEAYLERGQRVTTEGELGEWVHVLVEGEAELARCVEGRPARVSLVQGRQLVGEELLCREGQVHAEAYLQVPSVANYRYTCTVLSQCAKLLKIDVASLCLKAPHHCLVAIIGVFKLKEEFREAQLNTMVAQRMAQIRTVEEVQPTEMMKYNECNLLS